MRSISNSIGIAQGLHYEMKINDLIRIFVDFYLQTAELLAKTKLAESMGTITLDEIIDIASVSKVMVE